MRKNVLSFVAVLFIATSFFTSCSKNETVVPEGIVDVPFKYSKIIEISDDANLVTKKLRISANDLSLLESFTTNSITLIPVFKDENTKTKMDALSKVYKNENAQPSTSKKTGSDEKEFDESQILLIETIEIKKAPNVKNAIEIMNFPNNELRNRWKALPVRATAAYPYSIDVDDVSFWYSVDVEIKQEFIYPSNNTTYWSTKMSRYEIDAFQNYKADFYYDPINPSGSVRYTHQYRTTFYTKYVSNYLYAEHMTQWD